MYRYKHIYIYIYIYIERERERDRLFLIGMKNLNHNSIKISKATMHPNLYPRKGTFKEISIRDAVIEHCSMEAYTYIYTPTFCSLSFFLLSLSVHTHMQISSFQPASLPVVTQLYTSTNTYFIFFISLHSLLHARICLFYHIFIYVSYS